MIRNLMRALLAAGLAAVAVVAIWAVPDALAAPTPVAGPCLFGHVDPRDDNSACRGSDSARFPATPSRPDGTPAVTCEPKNDGLEVRTDAGEHGWRYWICKSYRDYWGHTYWEWTEVLGS
ncbi:hypothetical protein [Nocardia xishanensis]